MMNLKKFSSVALLGVVIFESDSQSIKPIETFSQPLHPQLSLWEPKSAVNDALVILGTMVMMELRQNPTKLVCITTTSVNVHVHVGWYGRDGKDDDVRRWVLCICQPQYPQLAAQQVIRRVIDNINHTNHTNHTNHIHQQQKLIEWLCTDAQDPAKVDRIIHIQNTLDEVMDQMQQNLEKVTLRGEQLQDLMKRTEELDAVAKGFGAKAKRLNRCCWLL